MLRRHFLQAIPSLVFFSGRAVWEIDADLQQNKPAPLFENASTHPPDLVPERGHLFDCSSCVFAREGKNVLTGGLGDDTAILWDATTGAELRRFNHGMQIRDLAIHPMLDQLLTCGSDHEAKLWDLSDGSLLQRFRKHTGPVLTAAFDPSGEAFHTVGKDRLLCSWSPRSSRPHSSYLLPFPDLTAAAFNLRGTALVARFGGKTMKVFDPHNSELMKDLKVPLSDDPRITNIDPEDHSIVLSQDGSLAAAYADYSGLVVYDLASGDQLWSHDFRNYVAMTFSIDGSALLVMSSETDPISQLPINPKTGLHDFSIQTSRISFFNAKSGKVEDEFVDYHGDFRNAPRTQAVSFRPDGKVFVAADLQGNSRLVELAGGRQLATLPKDNYPIASIAISPSGKNLAIADSRNDVAIWDLDAGAVVRFLSPLEIQGKAIRFTGKGDSLVIEENNWFRTWSISDRKQRLNLRRQTEQGCLYPIRDDATLALRFPSRCPLVNPDDAFAHDTLLCISNPLSPSLPAATIVDLQQKTDKGLIVIDSNSFCSAAFGPDGGSVFAILQDRLVKYDLSARQALWTSPPQKDTINNLAVSSDGNRVLTGGNDGLAILWDASSGALVRKMKAHPNGVSTVAFSQDGKYLLTGGTEGNARLWDSEGGHICSLIGHTADVTTAAFVPKLGFVATGSSDGTVRFWTTPSGTWVCTLRRIGQAGWAVVAPDGRFDTDNLDEVKGLHWVFRDDPYHALNPEHYLRDFYEPRLLSRLLFSTRTDEFKPIRPLQTLNRAVPQKPTLRVSQKSDGDTVTIEVDVAGDSFTFESNGYTTTTSAYDLHLFRDGQLIRQFPAPKDTTPEGITESEEKSWQSDKWVADYPGKKTVAFDGIKLPHGSSDQAVEFSAYCFSNDRVKSPTGSTKATPLVGKPTPRAYLVAIGVNDYGGFGWNLQFANDDAKNIIELLGSRLARVGLAVEPFPVLADALHHDATKQGILDTIDQVAQLASPDDLVFVFYSGHGYSGAESGFYILPSDTRPGEINWALPSSNDLSRLISSKDLAKSFRGMEAEEIVFVIDACHAAASVDSLGFKPGPLGVGGLGQLAYDKRMRVLAASQTQQTAEEMAGKIHGGILTYVLAYEGLVARQAVNDDGDITLASWLGYSLTNVPRLFQQAQAGYVNDFGVPALRGVLLNQAHQVSPERLVQTPVLFDFRKGAGITIVART